MRWTAWCRVGEIVVLGGALMAHGALPILAERVDLPARVPLTAPALLIDLDEAALEIVVGVEDEPVLSARYRAEGPGEAWLEIDDQGDSAIVRRDGAAERPLLLRLTLGPGQSLAVAGRELEIVALPGEEPPAAEDASGEEPSPRGNGWPKAGAAAAGAALKLQIEDSDLQLYANVAAVVTASGSSIFAEGVAEPLALQLDGGNVEIRDHEGNLEIRGEASDVWLGDFSGSLTFELRGGGLTVRGGRGSCAGTLRDGSLDLDGWQGPLKLNGIRADFEIRAPEDGRSHLKLTGDHLDALIGPFSGALTANLRAGRLQLRDQRGKSKIHATADAEIGVERARGAIDLTLDGASATLREIAAGTVKVGVIRGRLDIEQVSQLDLTAESAEVTVRGVERLTKAQATDSYLELDFADLRHDPKLDLLGASEAWVTLATPCSVRLSDEQLVSNRIDVTGCRLEGLVSRRDRASERGVGGNRRLRLTAQVSEESTLRVEGDP